MAILSKALAGAAAIVSLGFATSSQAMTFFQIDTNPGGDQLLMTKATNKTSSTGTVDSDTISILANSASDFASGFGTIKPNSHGLTTLTFTPTDPNAFIGFSFRGQDQAANQLIKVIITDNQGDAPEEFDFTNVKANQDFSREGIISAVTGKTIKSIELINSGGFKEAKQFEFTLAPVTGAVPEPATWAMMLVGFGGLGAAMRSRRARRAVA